MTNVSKQNKLRRAFEFAVKGTAVLAAGALGTKLMGDPLPAMQMTNGLLHKSKNPKQG